MDTLDSSKVQDAAMEPMLHFSHDADAALDIKCRRLIRRLGYEGYGRRWRLCELMASPTGHAVPLATEEDRELLCDELRCDGEELSLFVGTLADVGLIMPDMAGEGRIASERMAENALWFSRRRANGKRGGRPRRSGKAPSRSQELTRATGRFDSGAIAGQSAARKSQVAFGGWECMRTKKDPSGR